MWSQNSLASSFTDVFLVVAIKCAILLKQPHTTKIALYSWTNGSLAIKSANM